MSTKKEREDLNKAKFICAGSCGHDYWIGKKTAYVGSCNPDEVRHAFRIAGLKKWKVYPRR